MEWNTFRHPYTWAGLKEWPVGKGKGGHDIKKLFRTEKEIAEEFVGLAVNKSLRLGRYLLLFPYVVDGKTFKTTPVRKWLCWMVAVLLTTNSFCIIILDPMLDPLDLLFWFPLLSSYATLLIHHFWMHYKKDKLDDFLLNLLECRPYLEVDDNWSTIESLLPTFGNFSMNFGMWFFFMVTKNDKNISFSVVFLSFQLGLFLCYSLLEQFILLLSLVRKQLSRTSVLADTDHDALIAAAIDLNKVFSPHFLLIITTLFVAILGKIYTSFTLGEVLSIYNIISITMQSYPVWRVVSNCQHFVKEVEQFYNRTYYHLLKHENKIEKRMEFHLSMRRKFVFTAGGMFHVNYQLLCGMMTTAATYIVVMLQFRFDKSPIVPDPITVNPQT